ncbi:hypothetical protein QF026_002031 [Streptomyces aurantiacus]|uniref:hypothetical protein n=1 Tax=Streptomyces aurantiacus TaxID=47760 RepID=UPI00278DE37D|nr:hypothetical protein [Streptomyces aurantiacus]MDQ0773565.1 hypothetical protein [Streptomyces aurantiacus]
MTDCLGLLLGVAVTAANVGDREAAVPLLQRLRNLHRDICLLWAQGHCVMRTGPGSPGLACDVPSCPLCGKEPRRVEQARCW